MNVKNLARRMAELEGPTKAGSVVKVVMTDRSMSEAEITALEAAARLEGGPHAKVITVRFVAPGEVSAP